MPSFFSGCLPSTNRYRYSYSPGQVNPLNPLPLCSRCQMNSRLVAGDIGWLPWQPLEGRQKSRERRSGLFVFVFFFPRSSLSYRFGILIRHWWCRWKILHIYLHVLGYGCTFIMSVCSRHIGEVRGFDSDETLFIKPSNCP